MCLVPHQKSLIGNRKEADMILSHKNRFLFIKNTKVAGTSVEMALSSFCGENDIITPISVKDELERIEKYNSFCRNYAHDRNKENEYIEKLKNILATEDLEKKQRLLNDIAIARDKNIKFSNHMHLKDVLKKIKIDTNNFLLVYICRNPYEQIVSRAEWNLVDYNKFEKTPDSNIDIKKYLCASFDEIIEKTRENIQRVEKSNIFPNIKVLRYESIQQDFNDLLSLLGYGPMELPYAKKSARNKELSITHYFDKNQIQKINKDLRDYFERYQYAMIEV